jgi:hypothetical protein
VILLFTLRHFHYLKVVDQDLSETVGQHVFGGLVGSVTNVWHLVHSLETPADPVVDTLGSAPVALHLTIAIALVSGELLRPLLDDLGVSGWCDGHGCDLQIHEI